MPNLAHVWKRVGQRLTESLAYIIVGDLHDMNIKEKIATVNRLESKSRTLTKYSDVWTKLAIEAGIDPEMLPDPPWKYSFYAGGKHYLCTSEKEMKRKMKLSGFNSRDKLSIEDKSSVVFTERKSQRKMYFGSMGVPDNIIPGSKIIPVEKPANRAKCTHCRAMTSDEDGCCTHCGAPIEEPRQSETLKQLVELTRRQLDEINQSRWRYENCEFRYEEIPHINFGIL